MYTRPMDEETKVRISISYSIHAQICRYTFYARIKLTARWSSALCRMYLRNASLLQRPAAFRAWSLVAERDGFPRHEAVLQENATKRAKLGYNTE